MKKLSSRLTALLEAKNGGNQSEMARFIGVTPQAVQKWMNGASEPRGKNLDLAAQYLGVSPALLRFGSEPGGRNITAVHPEDPLPDDVVLIPEYRIEFSGGDGRVNYEVVEEDEPATYRLSWFRKRGINPSRVRRFRVTGDSMVPMLYPRDTILVNLDETDITDGHVYAFRYGEQLRVKYVNRLLDGTLILRSVNTAYKDEEVLPDIADEHITIIGRVRDKSGAGGL